MGKTCLEGIERWDRIWQQTHSTKPNESLVFCVSSLFEDLNGKRFLDIGAGRGNDITFFAEKGAKAFALDYSKQSVKLIKKLSKEKNAAVNIVIADLNSLPFSGNSFDLVYSQGVLEHFKEIEPFIKAQKRVLKKGGFLLVDVPQKYSLYTLWKQLMGEKHWTLGWETQYSFFELKRVLEKNGFRVCSSYGTEFFPYLHLIGQGITGKPFMPGSLRKIYLKLVKSLEKSFFGPFFCVSVGVVGVRL